MNRSKSRRYNPLRQVLKASAEPPEVHERQGQALMAKAAQCVEDKNLDAARENYCEALSCFTEVLAVAEDRPYPHLAIAKIYCFLEAWGNAEIYATSAIEKARKAGSPELISEAQGILAEIAMRRQEECSPFVNDDEAAKEMHEILSGEDEPFPGAKALDEILFPGGKPTGKGQFFFIRRDREPE